MLFGWVFHSGSVGWEHPLQPVLSGEHAVSVGCWEKGWWMISPFQAILWRGVNPFITHTDVYVWEKRKAHMHERSRTNKRKQTLLLGWTSYNSSSVTSFTVCVVGEGLRREVKIADHDNSAQLHLNLASEESLTTITLTTRDKEQYSGTSISSLKSVKWSLTWACSEQWTARLKGMTTDFQ